MNNIATNDIAEARKNGILINVYNTIDIEKSKCKANNKILLYGFICKQIKGINIVCTRLSYHDVNNELRWRKSKKISLTVLQQALLFLLKVILCQN